MEEEESKRSMPDESAPLKELFEKAWRMGNSDLSIYSRGLFVMRPLPACQVFGEVLKQLALQADLGKDPRAPDVWGPSPDSSVCQRHASSPKSD